MRPSEYRCDVSSTTSAALELLSASSWIGIEFSMPIKRPAELCVQTSEIHINCDAIIALSAVSIDIAPKLEVFRLGARPARASDAVDQRAFPRSYSAAGELMSAFVNARPRLFIAGRRHVVPKWATSLVGSLLVEDLL